MDLITHTFGFPRIGLHRELKFSVERYWQGALSEHELVAACRAIRQSSWEIQASAGISLLPVNDFSLYDHVLDTSNLLGVMPERFKQIANRSEIETYFLMARGAEGIPACAMKKWFNTNYHYIVPELHKDISFKINSTKIFDEVKEALSLGHTIKPVLLGPLTWLWLGRALADLPNKLTLLPALMKCYQDIISQLAALKVDWVQLDEPILALDLPEAWLDAFNTVYREIHNKNIKIMLATYYGSINHHLSCIADLDVDGVHVDVISGKVDFQGVASIANSIASDRVLSVGVVDGRNIWRAPISSIVNCLRPVHRSLGERLWLSSSCPLMHVPMSLEGERLMESGLKNRLAFASEKCFEMTQIAKQIISEVPNSEEIQNADPMKSPSVNKWSQFKRAAYSDRKLIQDQVLDLPLLPTTTIGSFPQTDKIRGLRKHLKSGELTAAQYEDAIREEVDHIVDMQLNLGLDVLVHGEPERNDMVEFFAGELEGFAVTSNGWVQSYGTRCVKPPIIYDDIQRTHPMTVSLASYAQALVSKASVSQSDDKKRQRYVKGMLTGPVTMLGWSFIRVDQPKEVTLWQMANALREEVLDLEQAGIRIIQIDEPAFREGLPLRACDHEKYFSDAVQAFKMTYAGVKDSTQIHTHMCYSEFNEIIKFIAEMDADVISIEASRSDMILLEAFKKFKYPNSVGLGVYDVHSPAIPSINEMIKRIDDASHFIPIERLWINPDCGLKTRKWEEVLASLKNMVEAAHVLRKQNAIA